MHGWVIHQEKKWCRHCTYKPRRDHPEFAIKLAFTTTNNEAEYEVVIAGIEVARELGAKILGVRSDFQVVVWHIQGE
jgi:ribonuclease HI